MAAGRFLSRECVWRRWHRSTSVSLLLVALLGAAVSSGGHVGASDGHLRLSRSRFGQQASTRGVQEGTGREQSGETSQQQAPPEPPLAPADPMADPMADPPVDPLADPLLGATEGSGAGSTQTQPLFDESSRAILVEQLAQAKREAEQTQAAMEESIAQSQASHERLQSIDQRLAELSGQSQLGITRASDSTRVAKQIAVSAYVHGDDQETLFRLLLDPETHGRATRFLDVFAAKVLQALAQYRADTQQLDAEQVIQVEARASAAAEVEWNDAVQQRAQLAHLEAEAKVAAFEAGSHLYVAGYRFPVAGPVHFIDSWGFPRMVGSEFAHWHEGTDIMAPLGREILAPEDGVMSGIGDATLGGHKCWIIGASGAGHYFAHLSGYAAGIVEGVSVRAGDVIGYVGDTGNADGGPPHLHYEIHPGQGVPVNPYPLLKSAWGASPIPTQEEALSGPARVIGESALSQATSSQP